MLKPNLHGYLMHMKLYNKLKAKTEVFNYQEYQKEQVQKKLDDSTKSRISLQKSKKVAVNQELFEEMKKKSEKTGTNTKTKVESDPFFTLVEDDRFKGFFNNPGFAVDKNSEAYIRAHPSEKGKFVKQKMAEEVEEAKEQKNESKLK